jgi:fructokinase
MPELLSLGVDLGGTKTEAALLRRFAADDARFEVLERERVPTPAEEGYDAIVSATAELARRVAVRASLKLAALPIGVGMPGAVTRRTGVVKNSNTVCLNGRPFREDLSRALGRSIVFENDANCFALAEARLGAARAERDGLVFGAILGTGVGGGLVFGGRVWGGPQNLGGEWGHHAVGPWTRPTARVELDREGELGLGLGLRERCYCGNTGCLELYLSGKAVERDYQRRGGAALPLAAIAERRDSDAFASAAIHEMLEAFGRGLANLIDILDPSAIVLGGGASNLDLLYSEGVERVRAYVFNDELLTPIVRHELGDSAGVLGAALLPAS